MTLIEFIVYFLAFFICIVVPYYVLKIIWGFLTSGHKKQKALLEELIASGFHIDHRLNSNIIVVFDDNRREVAFVASNELIRVAYGDVISWQWTWTEGNGVQFNNHLNFTIKNVRFPLIKIPFRSDSTSAEHWDAKVSAILNR